MIILDIKCDMKVNNWGDGCFVYDLCVKKKEYCESWFSYNTAKSNKNTNLHYAINRKHLMIWDFLLRVSSFECAATICI